MKYYVEAKFGINNDSLVIRPGYSANAEILLRRKTGILAINEKYLKFDNNDSAYVLVVDDEKVKKRFVSLGLSDGLNVEIRHGLSLKDKIKESNTLIP